MKALFVICLATILLSSVHNVELKQVLIHSVQFRKNKICISSDNYLQLRIAKLVFKECIHFSKNSSNLTIWMFLKIIWFKKFVQICLIQKVAELLFWFDGNSLHTRFSVRKKPNLFAMLWTPIVQISSKQFNLTDEMECPQC